MNLLMLIIIFLAVCVAGGVIYFAWTLTPKVPKASERRETQESTGSPDSDPGRD
jgi:flagellar basal body-associated protein FliL